jgi:hypothetical protein
MQFRLAGLRPPRHAGDLTFLKGRLSWRPLLSVPPWPPSAASVSNRGGQRRRTASAPLDAALDGPRASSILVCHLPKSAKQMLVVEFADLEIGSAAERYRPSMAKYLPKPLRALYRGGRARAINGFTSSNAAINEIKRQCHERNDFGQSDPPYRASKPRTDRTHTALIILRREQY